MRPLLILTLMVTICHGRPGGYYNYPGPTPSAPPAVLSNLGTPSPSVFNLPSPTASVAPQVFLPSPDESPAPAVINLSAPLIAPSLLVENVVGAGQYGQPLIQSLNPQQQYSQSLTQPLGLQQYVVDQAFSRAFPHLQLALNFEQPGLSFGGSLPFLGLPQSQPSSLTPTPDVSLNSAQSTIATVRPTSPSVNPGLNFEQPGFSFGGSLPFLGLPQSQPLLNFPEVSVTPSPEVSLSSTQSNVAAVRPTRPTVEIPEPNIHASEEVEIQKHVYVHVPPEEPRTKLPPRRIVLPAPRKHYRIIFIKAPTPPEESTAPIVVPQVQDEEKTFVYVLVKKPEEQPEIKIKPAPPQPPTKPEVYFINYDAKKGTIELPNGTGPIDDAAESIPNIEENSNDPTVPTVRIGGPSPRTEQKNVDLNLNKASLTGGSALSLSVTGSPLDKTLHVSNTQPPPESDSSEEK